LNKGLEGLKKLKPVLSCSRVEVSDMDLDGILIVWEVRASN